MHLPRFQGSRTAQNLRSCSSSPRPLREGQALSPAVAMATTGFFFSFLPPYSPPTPPERKAPDAFQRGRWDGPAPTNQYSARVACFPPPPRLQAPAYSAAPHPAVCATQPPPPPPRGSRLEPLHRLCPGASLRTAAGRPSKRIAFLLLVAAQSCTSAAGGGAQARRQRARGDPLYASPKQLSGRFNSLCATHIPCASWQDQTGEADIGGTCIALLLGCTVRKKEGEVSSAAKRRIGGAGS